MTPAKGKKPYAVVGFGRERRPGRRANRTQLDSTCLVERALESKPDIEGLVVGGVGSDANALYFLGRLGEAQDEDSSAHARKRVRPQRGMNGES